MAKLAIFLFCLYLANGVASYSVTIHKNCSDLTNGNGYQIPTEEELGKSLKSCEQEWSLQGPGNQSIQVGLLQGQHAETAPPVMSLTRQQIQMASCVNLTLTAHCEQVISANFWVIPSETESTGVGSIVAVVVPVTIVLILIMIIIIPVACKKKQVFRCSSAVGSSPLSL